MFSVIIIIVRYVRGEAFDLNTILSAYLAGQSVGGIFATHLLKLLRERLVIMTNMQGTMDMQQQIMHEQNLVLLRQATALATAPEEGKLN